MTFAYLTKLNSNSTPSTRHCWPGGWVKTCITIVFVFPKRWTSQTKMNKWNISNLLLTDQVFWSKKRRKLHLNYTSVVELPTCLIVCWLRMTFSHISACQIGFAIMTYLWHRSIHSFSSAYLIQGCWSLSLLLRGEMHTLPSFFHNPKSCMGLPWGTSGVNVNVD